VESRKTEATPLDLTLPRKGLLERLFKLSLHGTTVRTELLAGLTTFITMAYIIFVNPNIMATPALIMARRSSRPASPPRWVVC
jgi:AGZA family xanthine/uracil permease-like MFS transporter